MSINIIKCKVTRGQWRKKLDWNPNTHVLQLSHIPLLIPAPLLQSNHSNDPQLFILPEIFLQRMFTHVLILFRLVKKRSLLSLRSGILHESQHSRVIFWDPERLVRGDLLWDRVLLVLDFSTEYGWK